MLGKIIKDWSTVDLNSKQGIAKLQGAFQFFMSAIDTQPQLRAAYQAFTTSGDFPANILQVLEKFHAVGDFDEGYKQIFDIRDFTNTTKSGFDLLDVESGMTFEKILPGEKIKIKKVWGDKVTVNFDNYGGALGWLKSWFDDQEYWLIEDTAIEFRNQEYKRRAQMHYALIEALGAGGDIAWQNPLPATLPNTNEMYTVNRDIQTIIKACDEILDDLKDKGYGVSANTPFFLLSPNALRGRITRALSHLNQAFAGSSRSMPYTIKPIYTLMLTTNQTDYYVGIPGKQMKGGNRMNLTLFNFFALLSYIETVAGWSRYAAAIGDTEQLRRCNTA